MRLLPKVFRKTPAKPKADVAAVSPAREDGFEAVLHIGAGKTGSSAIQAFIGDNLAALGRLGFVVPSPAFDIGPASCHAHVTPFESFFAAKGAGLTPTLTTMMAKRGGRTVLISAENICENRGYFEDFCRAFKVKVILYIRRQDEYLESAWQQWHSKSADDIAAWLDHMLRLDVISWDAMVDGWTLIAGAGNVFPRVFDRQRFPAGHVARDFLDALAGPRPDAGFSFRGQDVNASWSNILTSLVAGRTDVFSDVHDESFYHWVGRATGDRYAAGPDISLLSRRDRERILAHYAEGNERLRAKYFPDRPSLFAPLDHGKYRYADEIDLRGEQIRVLTDIVTAVFKAQRG